MTVVLEVTLHLKYTGSSSRFATVPVSVAGVSVAESVGVYPGWVQVCDCGWVILCVCCVYEVTPAGEDHRLADGAMTPDHMWLL